MRFILSAIAFVLGVVSLAIGGVQFANASALSTVVASGTTDGASPLVVLDDQVLASHAGTQTLTVSGTGPIVVAIGRTTDVNGWVGDTQHENASIAESDEQGKETLNFVASGTEATAPDPAKSDLWYEAHSGEGTLTLDVVVAPGFSVLIASDGTSPAPSSISVTWPQGGYAPWSGPLLVLGAVLVLIALALVAWALRHRRRMREAAIEEQERERVRTEPSDIVADDLHLDGEDPAEIEAADEDEVLRSESEPEGLETAPLTLPLLDDEDAGDRDSELEPEPTAALSDEDAEAAKVPAGATSAAMLTEEVEPEHELESEDVADSEDVQAEPDSLLEQEPTEVVDAHPLTDTDADRGVESETDADADIGADAETAADADVAADADTGADAPETGTASGHRHAGAFSDTRDEEEASSNEPEPVTPSDPEAEKWRRPRGRNRGTAPKQMFLIAPAMIAGLALSGCAPQYWPQEWTQSVVEPTGTPASTIEAAIIEGGHLPPVLSASQISAVIADAAAVAQAADASHDAAALEPRFGGDALAARTAEYQAVTADASLTGPAAFPTGEVVYQVPQATESWPRTVFAVVNASTDASSTAAPFAVTLEQASARDNFKVVSLLQVTPGASLPNAAPVEVGAQSAAEVADTLVLHPDQLAAAYADVIANGDASQYASTFDPTNDTLRANVNQAYRDGEVAKIDPAVASVSFAYGASATAPLGVSALDGGAIVAVSINEQETQRGANDRSRITVQGRTAALAGVATSQYGFERTYTDQLLFFVPAASSGQKIQYLGSNQVMTSVKELTAG